MSPFFINYFFKIILFPHNDFLKFIQILAKKQVSITSSVLYNLIDAPPNSLKDSNASLKVKIMEGVKVHTLVRSIWGRKGCVISRMGIRMSDKRVNISYEHVQTNNKLVSA
jgi:hypothetical protein